MKKLFFLFFALVATTSLWAYDFWVGDIYYNYLDGNNVEVTYNRYYEYSGEVIIPSTVTDNGTTYSVTSIGERAFAYCSSLTSVTIGNSVTSIGDYAFDYCSSLTSVTIGNSVTSIGEWAFAYCSSLTSVTIGNSVTSIGDYAFACCSSLTSVTIGNSVESIGEKAFSGCPSLTSVTIGNSVESIGEKAFSGCSSLTSVTINSNAIVSNNYSNDSNISHIFGSQVTKYIIGESVTSIGDFAFYGCSSLTSITIPNSVTSIGERAFENCSSLTSIIIPENVTSIGYGAFLQCSSLNSVVWNAKNCININIDLMGDNVYTLFYQSYLVPSIYPNHEPSTYSDVCPITSFIFGNEVEYIPEQLCYYLDKLTSVTIPNSVTSIGDSAFAYCSSLTSVTIGNSVTSIGEWAFLYCSSLTSVTIPNSVTSIGDYAFAYCSSLTSMFVEEGNTIYDSRDNCNAIIETATNTLIAGCQNTVIPNSVTSIGYAAFAYCSSLTSITIPNSVTSIGDEAFYNCSSLTSITIPNSVTSIGYSAFEGCSSLTSVSIPNSVTSIGNYAFAHCSSLTSVTIGNSVTSIGERAFENCFSLSSITIPNSVESIGYCAFLNCSSLTSITIGNSVTSIGNGAFSGCSSLTSITIPNSVTSIGGSAFSSCSSLTSITIPNSVTSIGGWAFRYCSSLTSVTIGNSVTSIGDDAFRDCSSLTSITIGNSVTSIGYDAFECCFSLTSVTINSNAIVSKDYSSSSNISHIFGSQVTKYIIGESVTSIGDWAFYDCYSLTSVTIPNSVTSIGYGAFQSCHLTSITCEAETPPTLGSDAFYAVSIPVYVPCGCVEAYKAANGWKDFTNIQGPLAEYSIEVDVNDNIMGTAKVDINSSCDTRISATANYGYHFVQWSDGATDNPRTLILTQDTTFTAEFAPNTYTISTQSSDTERGTTSGDVTTIYLDYVTISATANYGYHFAHWDDDNYENPRQVQVTEDKIYTAYFDKNTYYITKNYDNNQGYVDGYSSGEYLDNITLTAKPNYGYHFVQWSDGNTDNPRHFILTQDTVFSAEFAPTFSGQCGDNLCWNYDKTNQTISITGSGDMYDYTTETQPWLLFKEEIIKVTTTNTVTSIGTSAFEGCVRLGKVSLGIGVENIAASAFAECNRLYDVYCYATYPPFAAESSFANYNVYLYVPCESQRDYTLDVIWGKFKFIVCVDSEEVTTDDVVVTPGTNDVTITWPTEGNADTYTIVIKKGNEVFCTLTFNAEGQLLNIAFAPGRDGNHPAQYAEQAGNGYRFTVTNLESGTKYGYNIEVKDASNKTIKSHSGEFTTQSTTAVDNITTNNANIQKIIRDGQLIIIRNGVEYNAVGQKM